MDSISMINFFVSEELSNFKKRLESEKFGKDLELSGMAISWLCHFYQDFLNETTKSGIFDTIYGANINFNILHYSYLAPIYAAAYDITDNEAYLKNIYQYLDNKWSVPRERFLKSLIFIFPKLNFDDILFREATENNIKNFHSFYQENGIILIKSKGFEKDKWTNDCFKINLIKYDKTFYDFLTKNGSNYHTSFFINVFSETKSYLIYKLFNQFTKVHQYKINYDDLSLDLWKIFRQEIEHPLNNCKFDS